MKNFKKCEKCGLLVYWMMDTNAGHMSCFNKGDNKTHWDKCSERRTKQAIKKGIPFVEDFTGDTGYIVEDKKNGGKKKMYMMQTSGWIVGKDYKPSDDKSVPWRED